MIVKSNKYKKSQNHTLYKKKPDMYFKEIKEEMKEKEVSNGLCKQNKMICIS